MKLGNAVKQVMKDVSQLGGAAVAGYTKGGPAGAIMGTAGLIVSEGLKDLANGGRKISSSNPASGPWSSANVKPGCRSNGLTTDGKSFVDTGRYLISFKKGETKIYDKQTDTWVRAWGDPHLHTGDSDKAQFHENMTIDLVDGTKVTFQVTPKAANGVAFIDSVAITKGLQAVVVNGLASKGDFQIGNVLNNADAVDAAFEDGTVLRAGRELDDLTFAADGKEILGSDPSQKWGEHLIDGRGGSSLYGVNQSSDGSSTATTGVGANNSVGGMGGMSISALLMAIMAKLERLLRNKVQSYQQKTEQYESKQRELEVAKSRNDSDAIDRINKEMEANGLTEGNLKVELMEIQEIQNLLSQITSVATNIQKTYHDTNMAIAGNIRP